MSPAHLLLVDDDRGFRRSTAALLRQDGYRVDEAEDALEAKQRLDANRFDLVLLDVRLPGLDGIELVEVLRRWGQTTPVLMISGFGTVESAVGALHAGADDFLTKPVEPEVLSARVEQLLARRPRLDRGTVENPEGIIGRSAALRAALETIRQAAPTDSTVLIQGETGTGKELAARALHALSPRHDGPFVAVNCASLSPGVVESELFGHIRGAFTGAIQDRAGFFESAEGRDDSPRRDWRRPSRGPASAPSRVTGTRGHTCGLGATGFRRRPCRRGDQPGSSRSDGGRFF